MLKKNHKETLADKIADVLNATPALFDPEDDRFDSTRAQVVDADPYEEDDNDEIILSRLRRQNDDLLTDFDERYAGVQASRKDFYDSDEQSDTDESEEEEKLSESDPKTKSDESGSDENGSDNNEESDSEEDDGVEEDGSENEEDLEDIAEDEENPIETMSKSDLSAQVKKGLCVRNQMQMWESLLEMRIQLQKCLITANKMPQNDTFTEIKKSSGKEFTDPLSVTKNSLAKVLDRLLLLQKLVLKKYPETKNLDKEQEHKAKVEEDEEIPSDTDDEKAEKIEEDEEEVPRKKRKLSEFGGEIAERHSKYKTYRNDVIQKWNEKTRIATIKNNSNAPSVLNHIEHILSDKVKLVKRTQLKRSEYTILGQEPVESDNETRTEEYNTEIFDDDDFYHQLLRELIEVKSADMTDPVQLSRQWIQLQNLRSKMKRKIDTRATKGRKIRYAVHTKLVNFMAPIDDYLWTDEAKNDLFNSLFGKLNRGGVV